MSEENRRRHIAVGGVGLFVNRNANIWGDFAMYLSRELSVYASNYDVDAPIAVVVVYIVPGYKNPVDFSGTRITIKSRKGLKKVQVEAAVPDMPFPEHNTDEAKKIILNLMLQAIEDVEAYGNKSKIISGELSGARDIIKQAWEKWDVSNFKYQIPEGLSFYDLPKIGGVTTTTRVFVEELPNGGQRHYNVVLDEQGNEII